jgi:hypothetical protein
MFMKSFNAGLALAALSSIGITGLGFWISQPAQAQLSASTTVDFDFGLPGLLFLRTFAAIDLDLPATSFLPGGPATSAETGITRGSDALNTNSPFTTPAAFPTSVNPLFAVWTTDADGYSVAMTITEATLDGPNGTSATISSVLPTGGTTGPATGLFTPQTGGANFTLDLTDATTEGNYTGGVITVTATTF